MSFIARVSDAVATFDNIRDFLSHGVYRGGQMTAHLKRNHRSINYSDIFGAVDLERRADHASFLTRKHASGSHRVIVGPVCASNVSEDPSYTILCHQNSQFDLTQSCHSDSGALFGRLSRPGANSSPTRPLKGFVEKALRMNLATST